MKHRPIHENLDTSFVNLQALIRYLRRRGFACKIHVRISGYEANIYLSAENQLKAVEHDQIAGRIAEGDEALQRILIRSREPGGVIDVFQEVAETEPITEPAPAVPVEIPPKAPAIQNIKPVSVQFPKPADKLPSPPPLPAEIPAPRAQTHPPLEFSNHVEAKARQTNLSPAEWQTLLNLTGEILETVNQTLAQANLDFTAAFQKARGEIAADYPFLNPNADVFVFKNGSITMTEQTSAKLFIASITEILQRILEKLGANPKFTPVYNEVKEKIHTLINHRKPLYDKFFITGQLEKVWKV